MEHESVNDVREHFKAYRKKLGLTQREFGERYGVDQVMVWRLENKNTKKYSLIGIQPGDKFGRLTVLEKTGEKKRGADVWICKCDCGNFRKVIPNNIFGQPCQNAISCGCVREKALKKARENVKEKFAVDGTMLNFLNKKIDKRNTSGIKGVSFNSQRGKWEASIGFKGKLFHIGRFDTKEEAATARREAERKYFAPVLHEHGMELKPREINQDLMKDDTYKREPFYDFGKGIETK